MTVFTDGNDSTDRPDRVNRRGPTVASARPHHAGTKTEADLVSDLNVAARCSGGGHAARMADVIYVAEEGVGILTINLPKVRNALTVRAMHTPGHRPEHTAFVLTDTARTRKMERGISGLRTCASTTTKPTRRARPVATMPSVLVAPQPQFWALTKP